MPQDRQQSSADFPRNRAAWVVVTVLLCLAAVVFFQNVPKGLRWPVRLFLLGAAVWLVLVGVQTVKTWRFSGRNLLFSLILGSFFYSALYLICLLFIKVMSQRDDRLTTRGLTSLTPDCKRGIQAALNDDQFIKFSAEMGWVPRPGYKTAEYTINAQGVRGTREYPQQAANPDQRILCMGDSFTFGVAVRDGETFPAQAEKLKQGTEWINFGIPGGCLTQAYQRYMHEARGYGGKHVVIGFMTDDAKRTVNAFRPFVKADSGCPLTKPFAKFAAGQFTVEPNPYTNLTDLNRLLDDEEPELKRLLKLDYLIWGKQGPLGGPIRRTGAYVWGAMRLDLSMESILDRRLPLSRFLKGILSPDPYGSALWSPDSPGFKAICAMFDQFHQQVVADGRQPLFVILPGPLDVNDHVNRYPRQYASLLDHLKSQNYAFVDFLAPLVTKHKPDLSDAAIFVRLHYQGHVNQELAAAIIKELHLP